MDFRKALVVIVWQKAPGQGEKKVLVLRLIPHRGGFWQPVTGKVEEGETYAEGALREATEESGLRFERHPQFLGLDYGFPGRNGVTVKEKGFFLPVFGGDAPPTPQLDGKEHDAFEWLSPAEAAARVKWPSNKTAIERAASGASPLFLSRRGSFFQDGEEVTHERTRELLHKSLAQAGRGWIVRIAGEELDVVLEDTPRFVLSFDRETGSLSLSDGSAEELRPETLRVRDDHSLVCVLRNGLEAAFTSPAYYEISKDVEESVAGKYVLHFRGRSYPLAVAH
jgi:8-oxo-dGTP pyrophosphatase MutT (NUDIX family)